MQITVPKVRLVQKLRIDYSSILSMDHTFTPKGLTILLVPGKNNTKIMQLSGTL